MSQAFTVPIDGCKTHPFREAAFVWLDGCRPVLTIRGGKDEERAKHLGTSASGSPPP